MMALGDVLDIGSAFSPVDFNTSDAATGHRVFVRDCGNIMFVLYKGAGTAGADPVVTVQEHTASSAGTTQTLAVVSEFYKKEEAVLDGDEVWQRTEVDPVSGTPNMGLTSAEQEGIYVIEIQPESLSAGYKWVSCNIAATVANAQLVAGLYILTGLKNRKAPENLKNLLTLA